MAELYRKRYNGVDGVTLQGGGLTNVATAITFNTALQSMGSNIATLGTDEYLPLVIENEIVYLTAYTAGATTGTISRGKEGTTAASHSAGANVVHGPTALDIGGDTSWTAFTYTGTWVDFSGTYYGGAYRKDANGWVHLRGLIKNPTANTNSVITTLPAGYRPLKYVFVYVAENGTMKPLEIQTNGDVVRAVSGALNVTTFTLDGIPPFYAEA